MLKCDLCYKDLEDDLVIVTNEDAHTCGLYCYDCFYKKGIKDLKKDDFIYKVGKEGGESHEKD